MREIKFRLIDTKTAVRIDPKEFFITDSEVIIYYSDFDNSEKADMRHHVILQYTGLKDRNGTEIYEGDIVLFDSKLYPVAFKNGNFGVKKLMKVNLYTDEMREYQEPLWNIVVDGCEVIGNIYENPELLERK